MGMFDSVMIDCPSCGNRLELQSKEGDCNLYSYSPDDAPVEVLTDVLNEPVYCRECDAWAALVDPKFPPGPLPRPEPKTVMLRLPLPHEVSIHSSQPYIRWWDAAFSFDDIAASSSPVTNEGAGR